MKISKGIQARPVKVCAYGVEGIGKSTFASKFPNPLFFDLDRGTARLDVDRVEGIYHWADFITRLSLIPQTLPPGSVRNMSSPQERMAREVLKISNMARDTRCWRKSLRYS